MSENTEPASLKPPQSGSILDRLAELKASRTASETARQKIKAVLRLYDRLLDNTPVRHWRYNYLFDYGPESVMRQLETLKAASADISVKIKAAVREKQWAFLYYNLMRPETVPQEIGEAISCMRGRFLTGEFVAPCFMQELELDHGHDKYGRFGYHFLHVSKDDPTKVAYAQSWEHLVAGRWTRLKPGRYLTKFFGKNGSGREGGPVISEANIRIMVQAFDLLNAPPELHFVENDDPDGWEWVYEHGHGFTSCMVYNHPTARYLDRRCCGENHPVRAYARRGNGLRLAWFGVGFKSDEGRVFARAVVRDDPILGVKGHVRIYGDDRLGLLLQAAGYGDCVDTEDVMLNRRTVNGELLVPYLDGNEGVRDMGDYLLVCDNECDYLASSTGIGVLPDRLSTVECDDCGDEIYEDDTYSVMDGYRTVCYHCRERNYTLAHARYGGHNWVPNDEAICVGDDYYAEDALEYYGIALCAECGEYGNIDDMVLVSTALYTDSVCVRHAMPLDRPCPKGCNYALAQDVVETADGLEIHTDHAAVCSVTDGTYHEDDLLRCMLGGAIYDIHPSALSEEADRLWVFNANTEAAPMWLLSPKDMGDAVGWVKLDDLSADAVRGIEYFINVTMGGDEAANRIAMLDALRDLAWCGPKTPVEAEAEQYAIAA